MRYENTFQPGDRVRIVDENVSCDLPDGMGDGSRLDNHRYALDLEVDLSTDTVNHYDVNDNSWLVFHDQRSTWVHEGCLELVVLVTQEDEDEAIASILSALSKEDS